MKDYSRDITRQVEFEALFNYASIGIVVTNDNGEIVDFNKYAEQEFGYLKNEIVGQKIEVLVPARFRSTHVSNRSEFHSNPSPRKMGEGRDLFATRKGGTEFPVEISLSYYKTGEKTYVIAFIIDISVRKKNEQLVIQQKQELEKIAKQITQLNQQLEQKVEDRTKMLRETLAALERSKEELSEALDAEKELGELKSRFVTMASHEFRTPLSTILSSAYLLEKYGAVADTEKINKHVQRIKSAVTGMKSILEDFLSLGKLEEGSINANIKSVTSEDCFSEMQDALSEMEQALKPGQKINFECSGDSVVLLDKNFLKNILLNLVSNAIKFSKENSTIEVAAKTGEDGLLFTVKDNGIGISEEDKQHLFERFFRARNAVNIQGTGLGLHIVVKYLALMNGNIEFNSELEKGTTFTIHIPANNQHKE